MLRSALRNIQALQLGRNANLQLIYSSSVLMVMASTLVYPVLPAIQESLNIPKAQIGWVISALTLPTIFTAPLVGFIADLRGRKVVLAASLLLYGAAGSAIAFINDFTWLLVLRGVQGVGFSGIMPVVVIIIGDTYTRERETTAQGMKVFFDRLGMLCLPALAGILAAMAWQVPFLLYGLSLPLAALVIRWLPEPNIVRQERPPSPGGSRRERPRLYFKNVIALAFRLRALTIFSISSLRFFQDFAFFTYLPIFALDALGISVSRGGFLFSFFALGAMFTSSQVGALAMRFDRVHLVQVAFFTQALCLLGTSLASSIWWLAAIMLIYGLANGICSPAQSSLLAQSAPGELRGGIVAADGVLSNFGKFIGPPVAGLILMVSDLKTVFTTLSAIALLWVLVVLVLKARGYLEPSPIPAR